MMWPKKKTGVMVKKTEFVVEFLGAKESRAMKGVSAVLPVLTDLIDESYEHSPLKVTLQISDKGIKIIQTIPVIHKSGKIKMDVMKFLVPHYSISFAMVAPPPQDDCVASIFLIYNPETRCCLHVHCYRCESSTTAALMNASLQMLINKPENIRRYTELDNRLRLRGLIDGSTLNGQSFERISHFTDHFSHDGRLNGHRSALAGQSNRLHRSTGNLAYNYEKGVEDRGLISRSDRVAMLHAAVFDELKQKLRNRDKCPILFPPKDYLDTWKKISPQNKKEIIYHEPWPQSPQARSNFIAAAALSSSRTNVETPVITRIGAVHHNNNAETSSTSGVGSDSSSSERTKAKAQDGKLGSNNYEYLIVPHKGSQPHPHLGSTSKQLKESGFFEDDVAGSSTPRLHKNKFSNLDVSVPTGPYEDLYTPSYPKHQRGSGNSRVAQECSFRTVDRLWEKRQARDPVSKKEYRCFGDTIRNEVKPSYQLNSPSYRSKLTQYPPHPYALRSSKPGGRFFSMEDLSSSVRNRNSVIEPVPLRESLWHLPSLVDPFGKMYERTHDAFGSRSGELDIDDMKRATRAQKCTSWYVPPSVKI